MVFRGIPSDFRPVSLKSVIFENHGFFDCSKNCWEYWGEFGGGWGGVWGGFGFFCGEWGVLNKEIENKLKRKEENVFFFFLS